MVSPADGAVGIAVGAMIDGVGSKTHAIASSSPASRVFGFLFVQALGRKQDGAVERIRQATMTTSDHHCNDDQLGEDFELGTEGRINGGVSERETDRSISGDDLKQDREEGEGLEVVSVCRTD